MYYKLHYVLILTWLLQKLQPYNGTIQYLHFFRSILYNSTDFFFIYYFNRHTYIHNWPLQPFSQGYGLASHTTHVVRVNFIRGWRDLLFKVYTELQIFWVTFSWQVYLLSEFLPEICWEEVAEEIRTQAFASNKPTYYILDHGDFNRRTDQLLIKSDHSITVGRHAERLQLPSKDFCRGDPRAEFFVIHFLCQCPSLVRCRFRLFGPSFCVNLTEFPSVYIKCMDSFIELLGWFPQ